MIEVYGLTIDPFAYLDKDVPSHWLPKSLAEMKTWTFRMLATDRTTPWVNKDGKQLKMPRQLLHIWRGIKPEDIADLPEDWQATASLQQQIAVGMIEIYPSESAEKKSKSKTVS